MDKRDLLIFLLGWSIGFFFEIRTIIGMVLVTMFVYLVGNINSDRKPLSFLSTNNNDNNDNNYNNYNNYNNDNTTTNSTTNSTINTTTNLFNLFRSLLLGISPRLR